MALVDDLTIDLNNLWAEISASAGTFYESRDLYSLTQNLFDEIAPVALPGAMAKPTPLSAQTYTDFTLKSGWYLKQSSYKFLKGGSIQTSGHDGAIYKLTLNSSGYTSAVSGDLLLTVTGGTSGATGKLVDYDNTLRVWRVRQLTGTFTTGETLSIGGGTGVGVIASSGGVLTGESGYANAYTVGTLNHGGTYFLLGSTVIDGTGWYGNSNISGNHIDILVAIKDAGALVNSGIVPFFNRTNRDAANALDGALTGDTYDWAEVDLSGFGRTPVPLTTKPDLDDTLTNAQCANLLNGTTATIVFATGSYTADINQDGSTEPYSGQVDQSSQANTVLWPVIKYYFRKGETTLINSVQAQVFRYLNSGYAITKDSPIGIFAGGKIFYARGWYPTNVPAADASDYQTTPTNTTSPTSPPVFYVLERTGVPLGASVIIVRRSSPGFALVNEFTLASGNNSGNGTLVLSSSIPADKPSSGYVRVFDDDGEEQRYAYASYSGATLTLSGTLSRSYSAGNSAYIPYVDTDNAASTVVGAPLRFVSNRDLTSTVRKGSGTGKIIGDTQNYTRQEADSSVPVTAIDDPVNNN